MSLTNKPWRVRLATPQDRGALSALAPIEPVLANDPWRDGEQRWLAEAADGSVQASLALCPALGLDLPRPYFHVGCAVHASAELKLFQRQRTLLLGHDLTGQSELRGVVWRPGSQEALPALLQAAVREIAQHRHRYAQRLIVELPGLRDAAGQSPFWQGFGRHFYDGDPQQASERWGALAWRSQVAALLPRHPVYASFLPAAAQAAIGQSAPAYESLRQSLERLGFRHDEHVRIDDAGPVLEVRIDDLVAAAS